MRPGNILRYLRGAFGVWRTLRRGRVRGVGGDAPPGPVSRRAKVLALSTSTGVHPSLHGWSAPEAASVHPMFVSVEGEGLVWGRRRTVHPGRWRCPTQPLVQLLLNQGRPAGGPLTPRDLGCGQAGDAYGCCGHVPAWRPDHCLLIDGTQEEGRRLLLRAGDDLTPWLPVNGTA